MNDAGPLVTVITCYLNAEAFLAEAIESVCRQVYENWEYILINDGSTDDSENIARRVSADQGAKVVHVSHQGNSNKGLSYSRNLGMSLAKGRYVCFLDADDVYLPGKLSEQVRIMEGNEELDMLIEATEYWCSWNGGEDTLVHVGAPEGEYSPPALAMMLYPIGRGQAPCTSSYLLRASSMRRIGGFEAHFAGDLALYEDQAFLCKYYLSGRIRVSVACHSRYRQHSGSMMASVLRVGNYRKVRSYFMSFLLSYMSARGVGTAGLRWQIVKALWKAHPVVWWIFSFVRKRKI